MTSLFKAPQIGEPRATGVKNGGVTSYETRILQPVSRIVGESFTSGKQIEFRYRSSSSSFFNPRETKLAVKYKLKFGPVTDATNTNAGEHSDDGEHSRRLVPIGDAKSDNHSLRQVNIPLASALTSGAMIEKEAGDTVTLTLFYRSVENGSLGDIVELPANTIDDEDGSVDEFGAWTNDSRCTLYIELE